MTLRDFCKPVPKARRNGRAPYLWENPNPVKPSSSQIKKTRMAQANKEKDELRISKIDREQGEREQDALVRATDDYAASLRFVLEE